MLKGDLSFNPQRTYIVNETSFFRDMGTVEYEKNYFEKNLSNKPDINIVIGGCSTGEDVWTQKMFLNDVDGVNVLGFDLSNEAIKKAEGGHYTIRNTDFFTNIYDAYADYYLAFDGENPLTQKQLKYRSLFKDFFREVKYPDMYPSKPSVLDGGERKYFVIRTEKNSVPFIQENVLRMQKFIRHGVDAFIFKNSLYHLTTYDLEHELQNIRPENELKNILNDFTDNVKAIVCKNGLFVLGAHEKDHKEPVKTILYGLLEKGGFEPAFMEDGMVTVWKKAGQSLLRFFK
ncbi:MAG: hypothetical protein LBJ74_02500 [Heliobacteriaceae bacterium]|nr:hypothetical protein [Heliobacteriaceae bacterium]